MLLMDLKRDVAIRLHVHMTAYSVLRIYEREGKAVKLGERKIRDKELRSLRY